MGFLLNIQNGMVFGESPVSSLVLFYFLLNVTGKYSPWFPLLAKTQESANQNGIHHQRLLMISALLSRTQSIFILNTQFSEVDITHKTPTPLSIYQPRPKNAAPTPNIHPHPLTDIQIWVRNGSSNPGAWTSSLEPRLLSKLLSKIRRLTLSFILLSYWLNWKSGFW